MKVEGGGEFSNAGYKKICQTIFRDTGLQSNIDSVYMYCNAAEHMFILSVKISRVSNPVKVGDMTVIGGADVIKVTNETYVPRLLTMLWDDYGDRVEQLSRLEIKVKLDSIEEMHKLMNRIVYDPREDLNIRILDGMDRVLPEGARVRYSVPFKGSVTIIASENPIKDEWKEKAKAILSSMNKGEA